jgi:transcriptional regulator with XRE-family HTH domain
VPESTSRRVADKRQQRPGGDHPRVATRESRVARGSRRANRLIVDLGRELRDARRAAGLSQIDVGRAAGLSHPTVSRIERGQSPGVSLVDLGRLLSVVGLDLSARAYPAGDPLRDAAHERLLEHFLTYLGPPLAWRREVPLPGQGDPRAWDAVIHGLGDTTAVEAETRVTDLQSLLRRLQLKLRDGGLTRLILLVADTHANRAAVRAGDSSLSAVLPLAGRSVLEPIAAGRHPPASGFVFMTGPGGSLPGGAAP